MKNKPLFYQMFEHESSTYTYLLADEETREAVLIDPVIETIGRDLQLVRELDLKLKYVLDTHVHADHITSAGEIRERTKAETCVGRGSAVDCADHLLTDGQELMFGKYKITALETPGHTNSCVTYLIDDMLFTGDTLLVRGTGRTDFQQGSSEKLYDSIKRLFDLKGDYTVYPGHDYRGQTKSSIELEKKYNPRIGGGRTKEEFVKIMSELKLANPKKIMEAVPANMACGRQKESRSVDVQVVDGIRETNVESVRVLLSHADGTKGKARLIDVREPDEYTGELGHIAGAELITMGPNLEKFLETADRAEEIIFVCRSGARSGRVTKLTQDLGFKFTVNLQGGMLKWNELKFPIVR